MTASCLAEKLTSKLHVYSHKTDAEGKVYKMELMNLGERPFMS